MNILKQLFLAALLITVSTIVVYAQPGAKPQYSTTNTKLIKKYEEAQKLFDERKHEKALEELNDIIKKEPTFIEPYLLIAEIHIDKNQLEKALEAYKKTFELNPDYFPNNYFFAGLIEINMGKYEDSKTHLQKFLTYRNRKPDLINAAELNIKNCEFALEAMKRPVPFKPINMGERINSPDYEYFPGITADGNYFLFTRRINIGSSEQPYLQEDFFVAKSENNEWQRAMNIGSPINTRENEGAPTFSADGHVLIFAACENMYGYGENRKGFGSCDLFYSQKVGDRWTRPTNMGSKVNSRNWESQPSFSSDGKTIYFIRGINTGRGVKDQDIYMSQLQADGQWSQAVKLSDKVNTPGREESVFIHSDNQTLYFSSDGHVGMGGLDIYMSKKQPNGEWGTPVNLGYPINTFEDENSILVSGSGEIAYFASNREGGFGGLDLYQFELYKDAQPEKITYMKGKVYNSVSKAPLGALFQLIDLETNQVMVESESNQGNGEFLVTLPSNKNYALNVSKNGYTFFSENFSLKDITANIKKPYLMDVPLQPIDTGVIIPLKNIFFETGKYDLKPESKTELQKLVNFLNTNSSLKIEIGGHTDNVGKKDDNQKLSQNRAKAVYDYLVANAISADRLTYKGYGDTKPKEKNDTDEHRAMNRRTEVKVTGK